MSSINQLPSNAFAPIVSKPSGKINISNALLEPKDNSSIIFICELGAKVETNLLQFAKTDLPILVKLGGKLIVFKITLL
jgi:hypothetical protein